MSDGEILVEARGVSKKFSRSLKKSLLYGLKDVTAAMFGRAAERHDLRGDEFWAVKDVSFQLRRGECLGLIGHNGAGKSTLLKILNGLIRPDEGEVVMRGRVGALIELGAGFNPILSGRENIYINGQVLGFSKKEIDSKLEAIIEFAEIGEFIDMPVQNYSSGMKVRLGFAVAAQMEPDVLIIDEVLAVGDIGFRLKCYNSILQNLQNSAVIIVSHSMPQIARVCSRALLMKNGKELILSANLGEVIDMYYNEFGNSMSLTKVGEGINLKELNIYSSKDVSKLGTHVTYGEDMVVDFLLQINEDTIEQIGIGLTFFDKEQKNIASLGITDVDVKGEEIRIRRLLPSVQFASGKYTITMTINETKGVFRHLVRIDNAVEFQVTGTPSFNQSSFILISEPIEN